MCRNPKMSHMLYKISYNLDKTLVLSIVCNKCENNDEKNLKEKNQLRY